MYFYLIQCENKNTDFLEGNYVHIKAKTDGSEIAVISESEITNNDVITKTQAELQIILDDWVDAENVDPPLDIDGIETLQTNIDLMKFIG